MSISQYLKTIQTDLARGNATEHTHRPALKSLIESLSDNITATNEPQRIKCGAPDYIVTRGQIPLGYIEAKDVGISLDAAEKTEQLERYRESLGNLILTDYVEFRWYVRPKPSRTNPFPESECRLTARLASLSKNGNLRIDKGGDAEVLELFNAFLNAQVPTVQSAKELAVRMAKLAQLVRDTIRRALGEEEETGTLHQQMSGFREVLLHDLTEEQFADMYAQTISYGLFAARCNAKGSEHFTREHAAYDLPKTNPFLRKMFNHIAGPELDERIAWAVDDLAELLHRANISAILQDFGKRTRREDPVVHFYETFLAAYDPKMREARGVYYTPAPVVSYIVRSIDYILKTDFKLADGLADSRKISIKSPDGKRKIDVHKILILDPATGTGTFLYGVVSQIFESFQKNLGMWSGYVSDHLLPRLFGFELLMAPYAVAHMKLGLQLANAGYDFQAEERLRVYLTNSLEEAHEVSKVPLFTQWLAEEANEASKIKNEAPVMVVLGNPPYSGTSTNPSEKVVLINKGAQYIQEWQVGNDGRPKAVVKVANRDLRKKQPTFIGRLMWDYFVCDGTRLKERNPKAINNDYVKFIRFAQWRIKNTGYGILAFITDNSFLEAPTLRGVRQSLMKDFDDIYIFDLHGNSNKKETSPDGSKDENVFDIRQGVSISIYVKKKSSAKAMATVHHAQRWGAREIYEKRVNGDPVLIGGKYHWLWQNDLGTTGWEEITPQSPLYLFVPTNQANTAEYEQGWSVKGIFKHIGEGFKSHRDSFAVSFTSSEAHERLKALRNSENLNETLRQLYGLEETSSWNLTKARKALQANEEEYPVVQSCLYRPFDTRFCLFHPAIMDRPRMQYQSQMLESNLALSTTRSVEIQRGFEHVLCTDRIMDHHAVSLKEANYLFPLYIYPSFSPASLLDNMEPAQTPGGRAHNFAPEFVSEIASLLKKMTFVPDGKGDHVKTFGPEDVFDYLYAVLHSPSYRSRYADLLKSDFPRLPLTSNTELFRQLCAMGAELVRLHLMKELAPAITNYPVAGDNEVVKIRYIAPPAVGSEQGCIWINREQYFEGVLPELWNFHVGGYQVLQKWLKDRKGRKLTYDDLTHYQLIVSAINKTIRLMSEIDEAIEEQGSWPLI